MGGISHPIVYSVHHASNSFDFEDFDGRCALTPNQRMQFSDFGSQETVPLNGIALFGSHSRGLVDLNRSPDDPTLFPEKDFGRDERRNIWLPGKNPTEEEHKRIFDRIYRPYHDNLLATLQRSTEPTLLVAWDNTAPYEDFFDQRGKPRRMRSVILSNNGDRHVGTAKHETEKNRITTCDGVLLEALRDTLADRMRLAGLPHDIELNTYDNVPNDECGYIANHYSSRRNPGLQVPGHIQSLQVEYNTNLTHDPIRLVKNAAGIRAVRNVFESALSDVVARFMRG